jgi:PAS domain S-box-containing protein
VSALASDFASLARQIFESAREGVVVLDREGRVRLWNPFMEEIFGIPAAEVHGLLLNERFSSVRASALPDHTLRALRGETSTTPDFPIFARRLRRRVFVALDFQPLRGANGEAQGVLVFVRDVTTRHAAEEALRRSEERLRLVLDATRDGVWEWDFARSEGFWSPRFRELLGIAPDVPVPPPHEVGVVVHPDDVAAWRAAIQAHLDGGPAFEHEVRLRQPDGSWRWYVDRGCATRDAEGRLVRIVGSIRDISERKAAEDALRRSEAQLRQIFSTEIVGIFVSDQRGRLFEANDAYLRLTGYTREDLEAGLLTWKTMAAPESLDLVARTQEELAERGISTPVEGMILRKDGARVPILAMVSLLDDPEARSEGVGVAFVIDLSARKELEAELLHSQKMESLGRLAGGLAHDFNNLLTAILGHLELADGDLAPGSPVRADLRAAHRGAERAAELVRQLLGFARKQRSEPASIDPCELVVSMKRMLYALLRDDVELQIELDRRVGAVRADPAQLEQVLLNLVANARDAMPEGGRVTVCVREEARRGVAAISVRDTGIGMEPAVRERAFEPFFTTKEPGRGTGLGLASVYGIVKQAGGDVRLESEIGCGSTVTVLLPLSRQAADGATPDAAPGVAAGGERVLVVDDVAVVRRFAARALQAGGFHVLEARDGVEALAVAAAHRGPIHLLLTDVVMPRLAGDALAEKLAQERPGIRLLFMSGHHDGAATASARDRSAFLPKPFTAQELVRAVRGALDRES